MRGVIASRVSGLLVEAEHTVTGIDNLNDAYDRRLKHWRLERLRRHPGFTFAEGDISDNRVLSPIWASSPKPDAVFNLAARAGVRQSVENPALYFDTNVSGTLNLLELARQSGVSRFLLASTSSLYGTHNAMPVSRRLRYRPGPLSPYAASKKAAEALCYSYHHLYGMDVAVPTVFHRLRRRYAEARLHLCGRHRARYDRNTSGFEVINLGSDAPVELMDAIHTIERLVGKPANVEFHPAHRADVNATWANIEKARHSLDWTPRTPFGEGLKLLLEERALLG